MIERPLSIFRSISTVSLAIRDGVTSCRALLNDCLRAYDYWESKVGAWVVIDRERAVERAAFLDEELKAGRRIGPLHGIPIGVKDIIDVSGFPTAAGVAQWASGAALDDAPMVARLRKAGAIILGKTVTTPYAWIDPPRTLNPWTLGRTPGGSSSGSAVAVATGMVLAAIGTQTGGSIIRPAAFCGVAGWKPSHRAKASTSGIVPFSHTLDTPGWLAREVTDIHILQNATGHEIGRTTSPISSHYRMAQCLRKLDDSPDQENELDAMGEELMDAGFKHRSAPRLGRLRGFFEEKADPEMNEALDAAVDRWSSDGCEISEVRLPAVFDVVHQAHRIVMSYEAARVHGNRLARIPEDYPPRMTDLIREGQRQSEADYQGALKIGQAVSAFFRPDLHGLVTPAALGPAPDPSTTGDPYFNSPWTFGGQPTLCFPIGKSKSGLPLGAQLIGRDRAEGDLIGAGQWCAFDPEVWPFDLSRKF